MSAVEVEMPVCYGNLGSCGYGQQCCSNAPRQVCRQVARRIPRVRNVTIPDVSWEEKCEEREEVRQECETVTDTRNLTVSRQVCNNIQVEECYNYTIPTYQVVSSGRVTPGLTGVLTRSWRTRRKTSPL